MRELQSGDMGSDDTCHPLARRTSSVRSQPQRLPRFGEIYRPTFEFLI